MKHLYLLFCLFYLFSCSEVETYTTLRDQDLSKLTGKRVEIEGNAVNYHIGPAVRTTDTCTIYIDNLDSWPLGYYLGDDSSTVVRVKGKLIIQSDLPVFIQKDGVPDQHGMPVPEGTNLKEARKRYVLKNATWEVISK